MESKEQVPSLRCLSMLCILGTHDIFWREEAKDDCDLSSVLDFFLGEVHVIPALSSGMVWFRRINCEVASNSQADKWFAAADGGLLVMVG
mmetsp:Transcript_26889/g.42170  ORF Transcript_26889/g.42170 Transcript_26889/m.42170 type:complete len:90 (+) Transcript_26889:503-772(+)